MVWCLIETEAFESAFKLGLVVIPSFQSGPRRLTVWILLKDLHRNGCSPTENSVSRCSPLVNLFDARDESIRYIARACAVARFRCDKHALFARKTTKVRRPFASVTECNFIRK